MASMSARRLAGVALNGSPGPDLYNGTDGDDVYAGGAGDDTINGIDGDDALAGDAGSDRIDGGKGRDRMNGGADTDTIRGGKGDDVLSISLGADSLDGGEGADILNAKKLDFGVVANARSTGAGFPSTPANSLTLGNGDVQQIFGVEDFIGSRFADKFYAGDAASHQKGGKGNDTLVGGLGNDQLLGDAGNDGMDGGKGNDTLAGGKGNDNLLGGLGADSLIGGLGNDTLEASSQLDVVRGGDGDDLLNIHEGYANQLLFGDAGADTFRYGYNGGVMQDFTPGEDVCDLRVVLSDEPNATFEDLQSMMEAGGGGTILKLDFNTVSGFEYVFIGVDPGDFVEQDFLI